MDEPFDRDEVRAAVALDEEIERTLAGSPPRPSDPLVTWLSAAFRTSPPPALARRVEADRAGAERQRLRPVRLAVAALAALLVFHGVGSVARGEWVARNLGEDYSPHAFTEGGLALIAVGLVAAVSLLRRSWLPVAVTAGVPLGLALGVVGIGELDEFGAGAALHLTQAGVAVLLAAAWWRSRGPGPRLPRDSRAGRGEEGT